MVEPLLKVCDLRKAYHDVQALAGIHLEVYPGETVVMMGPSGCGKSTAIRCIGRLIEPDAGTILFKGQSVLDLGHHELLAFRRRIGFVFQQFGLIARLTALENVAFGLLRGGLDRATAEAKAWAALCQVGMTEFAHRRPGELSGGQQQRVGIARALAMDPALMLWDEPTAALDPMMVDEILQLMARLARGRQTAMIVVTHELSFALGAADRIVLMSEGRVVEEGPPEQIFLAPASELGHRYRRMLEARLRDSEVIARFGSMRAAGRPMGEANPNESGHGDKPDYANGRWRSLRDHHDHSCVSGSREHRHPIPAR